MKDGACVAFEDLPHGPTVEVSDLPSAGDGAPGCRVAPSYAARNYSPRSYTTASGFTYVPSGGFYGGQLIRPGPGPNERTVIQLPWLQ